MRDNIKYNIFRSVRLSLGTSMVIIKFAYPGCSYKDRNGRNYLYPVRLKNQDISSFSSMIGSMADRIMEGLGGGVSIDDIMDLNNAIARSGWIIRHI